MSKGGRMESDADPNSTIVLRKSGPISTTLKTASAINSAKARGTHLHTTKRRPQVRPHLHHPQDRLRHQLCQGQRYPPPHHKEKRERSPAPSPPPSRRKSGPISTTLKTASAINSAKARGTHLHTTKRREKEVRPHLHHPQDASPAPSPPPSRPPPPSTLPRPEVPTSTPQREGRKKSGPISTTLKTQVRPHLHHPQDRLRHQLCQGQRYPPPHHKEKRERSPAPSPPPSRRKSGPISTTLKTASAINSAKARGLDVETNRKQQGGTNRQHGEARSMAKLDNETEELKHDRLGLDVGRLIQQARQAKEMTQKDLAQKINEKPQVINEYEAGKAVPNQQVMGKLERTLNVRLRGKDKGKPMNPPSKK